MHPKFRLAARVAASLLIAAVLTACGGGKDSGSQSAAEFRTDFVNASSTYKTSIDGLKNQARTAVSGGQAQMLSVYEQMRSAVSDARATYGALDAPAEVDDDFKNLLKALDGQKDALDTVISSASASNASQLTTSLGELARLLGDFAELHQKIDSELRD